MASDTSPKKVIRRRRRANAPGGRTQRHEVWLTEHEAQLLGERATEQDVTIPRLLVEAATGGGGATATERHAQITRLFEELRMLNGMAVNINQLARLGNTDERLPVGTAKALDEIAAAVEKLNLVLDEVAGA